MCFRTEKEFRSMTNISISSEYTSQSKALLKSDKNVLLSEFSNDEELGSQISETKILLIRSKTKIHEKLIAKAKNLELIITSTSGFDHIDLQACNQNNIKVAHTPTANAQSAAELTMGLIINLLRKLHLAQFNTHQKNWKSSDLFAHELSGKTIGIVGLGNVGSRVAKMADAFTMDIIAHDPYQTQEHFESHRAMRMGFLELIRHCDIISFHVPHTSETHEMLNAKTLAEASPHLIVINTSRGKIIREPDFISALKSKSIGQAAIDVYSKEPLPKESELYGLKNIFMTPHIGAYTEEAFQKSSEQATQLALSYLDDKKLSHSLPPEAPWASKLI